MEVLRTLTLAAVATAASVAVAVHAETHLLSLLVLLLEPLLWFLLGAACLYALVERRWGLALVAGWALTALAVSLRQPVAPVPPPPFAPEAASPVVRNCASLAQKPQGPLSVLTWNISGDVGVAPDIVQSGADLVVLQEATAERVQQVTAAVQEALLVDYSRQRLAFYEEQGLEAPPLDPEDTEIVLPTAEGLHVDTMNGQGLGLIVRNGEFSYCGDQDRWPVELPAAGGRLAHGALVFATFERQGAIRDYDLVPLLGLHMDRPTSPVEMAGWPERLTDNAETIAGFVRALNSSNLIIAGDTNTHGTFRELPGALKGAGLIAVPPRASWPARLLGIPALPLFQLDRVWHGPGWTTRDVRTLRGRGGHLGVLATLDPVQSATAATPTPSR